MQGQRYDVRQGWGKWGGVGVAADEGSSVVASGGLGKSKGKGG